MRKLKNIQVFALALFVSACQTQNLSKPPLPSSSPLLSASAVPSPSVFPGLTSPSPVASSVPAFTPKPGSQVTPIPQLTPTPQPKPTASSLLPAGASVDASLKAEMAQILEKLSPGIQSHALVSEITHAHALQLAQDSKNTQFQIQATYDPISPSALQILMMHAGVFASDNLLNAYFSDSNSSSLLSRFSQQISKSMGNLPFTHYALEVIRKDSSWYVSLVLLTEIVTLKGLQLEYAQPAQLSLQGSIRDARFQTPSGLLTRPDGQVESLNLSSSDSRFELPLDLSSTGYYSFEINVVGPYGPQPATNFVVAVGVPYPKPENQPVPSPTPLPEISGLRQLLLNLVNSDRQAMGLSALSADPLLAQAAQNHSEDMINQGYIGHNSPSVGSPQQQVALAGVSDLVAQNIAISHSPENAQRELMSSPGHRKTLIKPEWTHVGFGISQAPDGFLYITQDFVQRKLVLDPFPASIKQGENIVVKGKALSSSGYLGVFLDGTIQGSPYNLSANPEFNLPVNLLSTGKHQLRIGISGPPVNNSYSFTFSNLWDFTVNP